MVNKHETICETMTNKSTNLDLIEFPNGVPGFPEFKSFYIKDLKEGFYDPLKLLVSADNPAISFILYPHMGENNLITEDEKSSVATKYDQDVDFYSVVTVREPNGHLHLTTNLKAPIVLSKDKKMGWQHILTSSSKSTSFPLDKLSSDLQRMRKNSA